MYALPLLRYYSNFSYLISLIVCHKPFLCQFLVFSQFLIYLNLLKTMEPVFLKYNYSILRNLNASFYPNQALRIAKIRVLYHLTRKIHIIIGEYYIQ